MNSHSTVQTTSYVEIQQLLSAQSDYSTSICRVNRHLVPNANSKAYEPEIVAIGPYHRHVEGDHLQFMEHHKGRYLRSLLRPEGKHNADEFVAAINRVESEARKCYAEPINLDKTAFVQMLILDGCFIIELVRKSRMPNLRERNDPIFQMGWIITRLKRDLLLFENQVPYFVLCVLFDLIEAPGLRTRLAYLLKEFFKNLCPPNSNTEVADNEIKHLLSLIRHCWIPPEFEGGESGEMKPSIISATRLSEANVSFRKNEGGAQLDLEFEGGVMKMAPLNVEDRTESLFRNLIAYEQYCCHGQNWYVSHYVMFLDCLIDSAKDVELLVHDKIIVKGLVDDDAVAKMVNRLNDSVPDSVYSFKYAVIFEKVNKHCEDPRNKWMAMLWRDYFNSPWRIISIVVALVFLLLTITQTVFTIYCR